MKTSIDKFRRHVDLLWGIWYRIDQGLNQGRNSSSTDAAIDWHYREAKRILAEACQNDADPLPEYLETHPRLAAKWNKLERRQVGLKA